MTASARFGGVVVVLLAALFWIPPALAKGPPDKLSLSGRGLAQPVEIADPASLAAFDPWTRGFIAWGRGLAANPPPLEDTYTVSFYLKRAGGELALIYVLHDAPDPTGGPGYIHIPGRGEPAYRLNIGTIITGDSDRWDPNGKWQYATAEWDAVMRRALSEHAAAAPAGGAVTPSRLPKAGAPPVLWLVPATAGALTAGLVWLARRRRVA